MKSDGKGRLTAADLRAFHDGSEARAWEKLGAALMRGGGVRFAVWAPNARRVAVVGDWNGWEKEGSPLARISDGGVWSGVADGARAGQRYKYKIEAADGSILEKADPYALQQESAPNTASIIAAPTFSWSDGEWIQRRAERQSLASPMSIYEVHLGSWMRVPEEENRSLSYREIAPRLADHAAERGFTHVEILPIMEHPFFGSWGYQVTGQFAPTHRQGPAEDFMFLVDTLHARGLGVILDWVPAHFPGDAHGLARFDGTPLYEPADPRRALHPDWHTLLYDNARPEVRSFLLSSAMFWIEQYHADALRVDGVASMLLLDFGRKEGEWAPNAHGGRENLAAVAFLKTLNTTVATAHPDVPIIAEESSAWPLLTQPVSEGGLGFTLKWDMGWMHDTLKYLSRDPQRRPQHQKELTFRSVYAESERFVLPLSHDEVVYGKGSLLKQMAGDEWQRFANLRLLYSYQWALAGKKLLFMGGEFGQWEEWNHDKSLDWHLLNQPLHGAISRLVGSLNHLYRSEPAMHLRDTTPGGFEWIDGDNAAQSILTFLRRGDQDRDAILVALNFTPTPRYQYRIGVPYNGVWKEILNSDARDFGGSGHGNLGGVEAVPLAWNGRSFSINVTLPPLGAVFFKVQG